MTKIILSGKFNLMYSRLIDKNPTLVKEVAERVLWFEKNSKDTRLENHALRRRMKGKWAFSITNDIRIVYEWSGKSTARFLAIGTHNQVYKSQ